jgi:hypothetical protein
LVQLDWIAQNKRIGACHHTRQAVRPDEQSEYGALIISMISRDVLLGVFDF